MPPLIILAGETPGTFAFYDSDSQLVARYSHTTKKVTEAATGTVRDPTPEESSLLSAEAEYIQRIDNMRLLTEGLRANVAATRGVVTAMNTVLSRTDAEINANPAVPIKAIARQMKILAKQGLRLAKLAGNDLADVDLGPE